MWLTVLWRCFPKYIAPVLVIVIAADSPNGPCRKPPFVTPQLLQTYKFIHNVVDFVPHKTFLETGQQKMRAGPLGELACE